ncbi:hypothetical protein BD410DRAFT_158682 [Rickenella mellea]|uniref:DUF6534 domain-containing protein n=1 Tax=Rickenella mellea TaxID=50990 RepID=A0A4Y7Q9B8_9AGAM|nr:hypothetical protein BD410DRAFT_158682 [Rickenella mellea]
MPRRHPLKRSSWTLRMARFISAQHLPQRYGVFSASNIIHMQEFIKFTVSSLFLMNTVNQMSWCQTVYTYMVKGFDDPTSPNWHPWSLPASCLVNAFIVLLVQGFYAWRLWKMSHGSVVLCGAIGISSVAAFIFNILLFVKVLPIKNYKIFVQHPHLHQELVTLDYGFLVCGAACDVIIAGSMAFLLHKVKSGIKRSDSLVNRLILYSIRTGLFTTIFAIASVILRIVPSSIDGTVFYAILTRLYANSMIALLNQRKVIRRDAGPALTTSTSYGSWDHSDIGFGNDTSRQTPITTHVTTRGNERSQHMSILVSGDVESADYNSSTTKEGEVSKIES